MSFFDFFDFFSGGSARLGRSALMGGAVAGALLLGACANSGEDVSAFLDPTEPADKTYNEALANIDAGDFGEAIKKFKKVDRQHPYSPLARRSVIMTTYLSYRRRDYEQAVTDGERFVSLYPSDEEAPYALYLVGMSHFQRIVDVTRDQKAAADTIKTMNEIITRYPESEYVEDARVKLRIAKDQLAAKEMLVGRYYQERREFIAAINRFRSVVENYQDTRHVEEALARLTESYYALGLNSEAQTAAAVLGHNFAESEWYNDSYALLQKGGLEPQENRQSWIWRATRILGRPADSDT